MQKKFFFSPGKLMLTGEYVVLNGAKSLAIPTGKYGQSLEIEPNEDSRHTWKSFENEDMWFTADYSLDLKETISTNDMSKAEFLRKILQFISLYKPLLFNTPLHFTSRLNFHREWGFGSSSSLLVLLYKWSNINPFILNRKFYGGSGYDIAVGIENSALVYQLTPHSKPFPAIPEWNDDVAPFWRVLNEFHPFFLADLKLVYLNKKQKSAEEIKKYKKAVVTKEQINQISQITEAVLQTNKLHDFSALMRQHEHIIAEILQRSPIQNKYFNDFDGVIKSLGAWGGDFVLAIGKNSKEYFKQKGFDTILDLDKMLI